VVGGGRWRVVGRSLCSHNARMHSLHSMSWISRRSSRASTSRAHRSDSSYIGLWADCDLREQHHAHTHTYVHDHCHGHSVVSPSASHMHNRCRKIRGINDPMQRAPEACRGGFTPKDIYYRCMYPFVSREGSWACAGWDTPESVPCFLSPTANSPSPSPPPRPPPCFAPLQQTYLLHTSSHCPGVQSYSA
jgi:hypothetical protein